MDGSAVGIKSFIKYQLKPILLIFEKYKKISDVVTKMSTYCSWSFVHTSALVQQNVGG